MNADAIPVARGLQGESDLEPLAKLLRAVADNDGEGLVVPSIDELHFRLIEVESGWTRSLQVWATGDEFVASFGMFHHQADRAGRAYGNLDVHPAWREPVFVDEMTRAACDAAAALVVRGGGMRFACRPGQLWKRSALERCGFTVDRYFHRMIAPIADPIEAATLPDGFEIRPLEPDIEVEQWVAAVNAGFADHYDQHADTVEDKLHEMTKPSYMPDADLVLVSEGNEIVGVGYNARDTLDDGATRGWVDSLAVVPAMRGRGLGRALLLRSLAALRAAGFDQAYLTVDSENETGALKLYTSVGFVLDHKVLVYVRDLEPIAADL